MARKIPITVLAFTMAVAGTAVSAGDYRCAESAEHCLSEMAERLRHRGWLGVEIEKDEATGAALIEAVIAGSPAEEAGIRPGDRILAMNGIAYSEANEKSLKKAYQSFEPGQSVTYRLGRGGEEILVTATLRQLPEEIFQQWLGQHMMAHLPRASDESP